MNALELKHLRDFCERYGLDDQLIDPAISYWENKEYLKKLVPRSFDYDGEFEEELKGEADALQEWYNEQSYADLYGQVPEGEIAPQFFRTVIYYRSRRRQVRFQRTKRGKPIVHGGNIDPHKIAFHKLPALPPLVKFITWIVPNPKVIERLNYHQTKRGDRFDGYITLMATAEDVAITIKTLEHYGKVRTIGTHHVYDPNIQFIPTLGNVAKPQYKPALQVIGDQFQVA